MKKRMVTMVILIMLTTGCATLQPQNESPDLQPEGYITEVTQVDIPWYKKVSGFLNEWGIVFFILAVIK